jgi:hypothetical protein
MNTARPKTELGLFLLLFMHGLAFLGGFCAIGVIGATNALSSTSELNRFHRAPTSEEAARGEVWFSGPITELIPLRTDAGVRRDKDPWQGCSLRAQRYRSGKNSGWYDEGSVYSYGAARVVPDEKVQRPVEVPLHRLGGGNRTTLSDEEARSMLPEAAPSSSTFHYVKDCFSAGWPVIVDGKVDERDVLVHTPGRRGAWIQARASHMEGLNDEAMWSCLGPLAFAGGFAWLWFFVMAIRLPMFLSTIFAPALGRDLPGSPLTLAMPFVGVGMGVVSYLTLFHSVAPLVVYVVAFSAFGLVLRGRARALALRKRLLAVLDGAEISGMAAAWGTVGIPRGAMVESLAGGAPVVVATELFQLTSKGALSAKAHTHVTVDPFSIESESVTSACDGSSGSFYGECTQTKVDGHDVRESAYGSPHLTQNRYAVRKTELLVGSQVVVVGAAAIDADSRAAANALEPDGYRGTGVARFFRRDGDVRVVVFQGTREVLRDMVRKDLATYKVQAVLLVLWLVSAASTLLLSAKYTLFH